MAKICMILFVTMALSTIYGCIISTTPQERSVVMKAGDMKTFALQVDPVPDGYTWYMDDNIVQSGAENTYTLAAGNPGDHVLVAVAGDDTHTWLVHVLDTDFRTCNPCVADVEYEFGRIWPFAENLAFWDNGLIPWPRYTQAIVNAIGIDNHFQGIQRLRNGPYLVISGGSILDRIGSIFIARMGSRRSQGTFGSNLTGSHFPLPEDRLIQAIDVDQGLLWHAGGMSVVGDVLVVPLEEYKEDVVSKIYFYNVSDPEAPVGYDAHIDRTAGPHAGKSGAVAMAMVDGRYLLASYDTRQLDFYRSSTMQIDDGFQHVATWDKNDIQTENNLENSFGGSSINFIRQCDGQLYMAGFSGNNGDLGPFIPFLEIENFVSLYRVDMDSGDAVIITKIAHRRMDLDEEAMAPFWRVPSYADFPAAAGIYIDEYGTLSLYSAPHYRSSGVINFSEFSSY